MKQSTRARGLLAWMMVMIGIMVLPAMAQDLLEDTALDADSISAAAPAGEMDMWNWPSRVALGLQLRSEADIDNGSAFSVGSMKASIGAMHELDEQWGVDVLGAFSRLSYEFSDTEAFGGTPWNDVNIISARGFARAKVDEQWTVLGGPVIGYSGESGAGESAMTGGAGLGAIYTVSPELKIGLLVAAVSRIEDSAAIVPAPLVYWNFAEQWSLRLGAAAVAASSGYGLEVDYLYIPELQFGLGARMQAQRFRLDDAGVAPDGVGEDKTTLVYAQSTWQALEDLKLQIMAGLSSGGTVEVDDANGDELASEDYEAALTIGARAVLNY